MLRLRVSMQVSECAMPCDLKPSKDPSRQQLRTKLGIGDIPLGKVRPPN